MGLVTFSSSSAVKKKGIIFDCNREVPRICTRLLHITDSASIITLYCLSHLLVKTFIFTWGTNNTPMSIRYVFFGGGGWLQSSDPKVIYNCTFMIEGGNVWNELSNNRSFWALATNKFIYDLGPMEGNIVHIWLCKLEERLKTKNEKGPCHSAVYYWWN